MTVQEIRLHIYAEDRQEAEEAQKAVMDFIRECSRENIAVSARVLKDLVVKFGNNPFVKGFLKSYGSKQ